MAMMYEYLSAVWAGTENPLWPHLVLVPGSVLAGIAVGAGIVLERPKFSEAIQRVAFWLVVLGIAIESICTVSLFLVDERISAAQESKIISLLPRELSAVSRAKFASCSQIPHTPVQVQSLYADSEGYRLGSEIMDALHGAGIEVDDKRGQAELDLTKPQPFGLNVEGPQSQVPFIICLANSIRATKELSGTVAKQIPNKYPLAVYVGLKPID